MKKHYIKPYCEIMEISFKDIIVTSGDDVDQDYGEGPVVKDGANGAAIYKAAYMTNIVHGTTADHGDLYDPFYTAPHTLTRSTPDDAEISKDPYSGYGTDTDLSSSETDVDELWN